MRTPASPVVAAVAALALIAPAAFAKPTGITLPEALNQCQPPATGRYALFGSGTWGNEPVAVLMQEQWLPGGRLEGVRYRRQGRAFQEDHYSGTIEPAKDCWASVERRGPSGVMLSNDALNNQGKPMASLITRPEGVLSMRYINQGDQICNAGQLNGLVTSQQQGQSWQQGRWIPNAVVQREWWQAGQVRGLALTSNGGRLERASYSGSLKLGADCLGTMHQQDTEGAVYNYKVLLLSRGKGYVYLQTDPNDMTLGLLQHQH
jgi:hypothetical protein